MRYTLEEIQNKVAPIAEKHQLAAVYLFGSQARGEATDKSDVDFIIDTAGSTIRSLFDLGGVFNDFEAVFGENTVDLVTLNSIVRPGQSRPSIRFANYANKEKVVVYEKS
jgi:predicted nucleotidyltransferase